MFSIKKKGREKSARFHSALKEKLSPHFAKFGQRLKLSQRIRLANMWAKKHPKKLMAYYSMFAVSLITFSLTMDFIISKEESEDNFGLNSLPSMKHRFQSIANTELQNKRIRQEINELGLKGKEIYNELDSLMKLPVKTHSDSVRIMENYNILNNTFNPEGHEL